MEELNAISQAMPTIPTVLAISFMIIYYLIQGIRIKKSKSESLDFTYWSIGLLAGLFIWIITIIIIVPIGTSKYNAKAEELIKNEYGINVTIKTPDQIGNNEIPKKPTYIYDEQTQTYKEKYIIIKDNKIEIYKPTEPTNTNEKEYKKE